MINWSHRPLIADSNLSRLEDACLVFSWVCRGMRWDDNDQGADGDSEDDDDDNNNDVDHSIQQGYPWCMTLKYNISRYNVAHVIAISRSHGGEI